MLVNFSDTFRQGPAEFEIHGDDDLAAGNRRHPGIQIDQASQNAEPSGNYVAKYRHELVFLATK